MLRVWNLSLLVATFALTILGTFLTRSGVLSSVHAFGDGPVGGWLLAFFGIVVVVSLGLIAWRGDRLRSPGTIDSPLSREGSFLANNVLFTVWAFVILLGTLFPLLVEALQDRQTLVADVRVLQNDRLDAPSSVRREMGSRPHQLQRRLLLSLGHLLGGLLGGRRLLRRLVLSPDCAGPRGQKHDGHKGYGR